MVLDRKAAIVTVICWIIIVAGVIIGMTTL